MEISKEVFKKFDAHVIAKRCFDMSFLLRDLTSTESEDLPVQTLSRADEKDGYLFNPGDKKPNTQNVVQTDMFSKSRDFK